MNNNINFLTVAGRSRHWSESVLADEYECQVSCQVPNVIFVRLSATFLRRDRL